MTELRICSHNQVLLWMWLLEQPSKTLYRRLYTFLCSVQHLVPVSLRIIPLAACDEN
jgi:hypothetical protein